MTCGFLHLPVFSDDSRTSRAAKPHAPPASKVSALSAVSALRYSLLMNGGILLFKQVRFAENSQP